MKNNRITEAIVLAGGFGTRLQHIVNDVPKPMAPINGIPFLSFLFKKLIAAGIEHVILSTGYLHEKIEGYFGHSFETLRISYSREQEPLGTGGAILLALNKTETGDVFVLNGDTLFDIDLRVLGDFHAKNNALLTVALREEEDVSRYGSVMINETGKITAFTEKNESQGKGLINGGIYVLNKKLLQELEMPAKFSFEKDVLEKYYRNMNFYGLVCPAYFIDIGVPEDYDRAQQEFPQLKF
jgi:D-glycero-alpha-D-manno-heptose 1-phosphate guanylyltransferase